jgi:hypothetical protein
MKKFLAAVLFLLTLSAQADLSEKIVAIKCGSEQDIKVIIGVYNEKPIVIATHKVDGIAIIVWANQQTQTSTWVVHIPSTGEYCTLASGTELLIIEQLKKGTVSYH